MQVLENADLEPVKAKFKEHLIGKNVAAEIADKLCESVCASLVGKKLTTFSRVQSTVKEVFKLLWFMQRLYFLHDPVSVRC